MLVCLTRRRFSRFSSTMQVTRDGLRPATGVARQGMREVGVDRSTREDVELNHEIAQDNAEAPPVQDTRNRQQNVEVAGETRVSSAETTGRTPSEVDDVAAAGPSDPVSALSSEAPEVSIDESSPSPAAEASLDEPVPSVAHETDQGSVEPSSRAEGGIDEATPGPSSTLPSPDREESAVAEEPPPARKAAPPTDRTMKLSPPSEVPDVELPPPPPVPQSALDELPPTPDEPTARTTRGEKLRIHVRKGTAAARRKAEELNVDLGEVEGTGRNGQITVGNVRKKAEEKKL